MKTITEFTSIEMKEAFKIRHQLLQEHRRQPKAAQAAVSTQAPAESAPMADPSLAPPVESTEPTAPEIEASAPQETAPAAAQPAAPVPDQSDLNQVVIKSPEQLFEERQAERQQAWQAQLDAVKPVFLAKLKERFSWSDERSEHAFTASEAVRPDRVEDLRAVRILKSEKEREKIPPQARKVGEFILVAEYYPSKNPPRERGDDRRGKGRRDGKRGKGRRGGPGGQRRDGMGAGPGGPRRDGPGGGGRPPRGPRRDGQAPAPKKS